MPRFAGARVAVLPRFAGDRVAAHLAAADGHASRLGHIQPPVAVMVKAAWPIDEARWIAQRPKPLGSVKASSAAGLMTHYEARTLTCTCEMRCKQPSREPIPTTPQVGVSLASHFSVCFPPRDTHTVFAAKRARVHMWRLRPSISSGTLQVHLEGAGLLTAQSAEAFFFRVFFFFFPAGTLSSR